MKAFPMKGMLGLNGQMIDHVYETGMDLRDYFAAKAMQSLLDANWEALKRCDQEQTTIIINGICESAYVVADKMVEAKEK